MTFSLILPSRDRVNLLVGLLRSLRDTTADIEAVELLVAVDDDDKATTSAVPGITNAYPFTKFVQCRRATNFSEGYYNHLAKLATGRFLMTLNDDVEFITRDWDRAANAKLSHYKATRPDGILLGAASDSTGCSYPCFPMLSREAFEALGWLQHPQFLCWGADTYISRVFHQIDRICPLPFHLKHHCPQNGTRGKDSNHARMRKLSRIRWPDHRVDAAKLRHLLALPPSVG